jgi:hypothetical protein
MKGRLIFGASALIALACACSSSNDGGGAPVPGVTSEGLGGESFRCVDSKPVKKTDLSRALHRECCCDPTPHHLKGQPADIAVSDCSGADPQCVNDVLATNGFLLPPWSATIVSYPPCMSLAVSYDPCGGICRQSGPQDGGAGEGDGDGDGHCGDHHHR